MALKVRERQGRDEDGSDATSAEARLDIGLPEDRYTAKVEASDCRSCMGRGFKYVSSRRSLWQLTGGHMLLRRPCSVCRGSGVKAGEAK
jgi:hypothetical protein